jgi:hypothetical protein
MNLYVERFFGSIFGAIIFAIMWTLIIPISYIRQKYVIWKVVKNSQMHKAYF